MNRLVVLALGISLFFGSYLSLASAAQLIQQNDNEDCRGWCIVCGNLHDDASAACSSGVITSACLAAAAAFQVCLDNMPCECECSWNP